VTRGRADVSDSAKDLVRALIKVRFGAVCSQDRACVRARPCDQGNGVSGSAKDLVRALIKVRTGRGLFDQGAQ